MADEERGRALKRRRINAGFKSIRELTEATKRKGSPISREAITAAEAGTAAPATYDRLDAFLSRWEEEIGEDEQPPEEPEPRQVTFRVHGNFGVDVVVQGPVDDAEELERVVERLIRGMSREQGD